MMTRFFFLFYPICFSTAAVVVILDQLQDIHTDLKSSFNDLYFL